MNGIHTSYSQTSLAWYVTELAIFRRISCSAFLAHKAAILSSSPGQDIKSLILCNLTPTSILSY